MTSQLSTIEPSHAMKQSSNTHDTSSKTPVSPKFNIDYVIKEFVREYYTIMINDPEKLHCFYEKQSSVLHCDEGDLETAVAMGIDDIKSHISRQSYQGVSVNISHYDGQYSMNDGIMIFVLGYMTLKGEKKHRFAQTFLLSETASGYFVLNDIRRLLNGSSSCSAKTSSIKSGDNKPVFMKREEFTKLGATIVAPVLKPTTVKEEEKPSKKTIPVVIKKKEEASSAAAVAPKKKDEVLAAPAVVESIIASSTKTSSWANMASNSGSSANVIVMKSEGVSPSPSLSTSTDIAAKKMKGKKSFDKTIKKRKENYLHSVYVSKVPSLYSQTSNESGRAEVVGLFEKWGDLQNIEFVRNGVMFVEYVTREACLAALAASDKGYYVLGEEKIPFKVDIRRTPEERKR